MSQKWRHVRIMLFLTAACVGILGWLVWREVYQQQLDAALIAAIKHNDTRTALTALHSHANPNSHDHETPLSMWQFLRRRWRQMHGEKIAPVRKGPSALALAVGKNNTTVVEALVDAGARDVGETLSASTVSVEYMNCTLLMHAAQERNPAIIRALARSGSPVNTHCRVKESDFLIRSGYTALAYCEDRQTVQALLDCGADINAKDSEGSTALDNSLLRKNTSVCLALLDRGAKDESAIVEAAWYGNIAALQAMLNAGWNVNTRCGAGGWAPGWTPLMEAVSSTEDTAGATVQLLLHHGADVNFHDTEGDTPLHRIAFDFDSHKSPAVVKALLDRGARIDAKNKQGRTPLMRASQYRYPGLVRLLLQRGARVNLRDIDGKTALSLAREHNIDIEGNWNFRPEVIRLLKAAGSFTAWIKFSEQH